MTTFNITPAAVTPTTTVADKPWFVNSHLGAVKLFPEDIGEWVELLQAMAIEKVAVSELTITVKAVDFYNLRVEEALNPALAGVKGTALLQLDAVVKSSRFDTVGAIYVTITSDYFEDPLEASMEIKKSSNNALLNKIHALVKGDVIDATYVSDSNKKERKLLKAIPK